jgi:phosphoglycolate phosphatase
VKLIVFDLDQTLVDLVGLHNEVTHRLLDRFFGIEAWLTEIEHAGRSQRDGLRNLAELKGVPRDVFEARADRILDEFGIEFAARLPTDASLSILPGVVELLSLLSRTDHVLVLYTGDAPGVVEAVMRATGLGRYFTLRFSGTEVKERRDMITLAIRSATTATGCEFKDKDIVIIGDSIRDVECGRAFGALTIGVTTGDYTAAELTRAGADCVFPGLEPAQALLEAIDPPPSPSPYRHL